MSYSDKMYRLFVICLIVGFIFGANFQRLTHDLIRPKVKNPKQLVVYIDTTPPNLLSYNMWHSLIIRSLYEWVSDAGCEIVETKNIDRAQIRFKVDNLVSINAYGVTHNAWLAFPYLPHPDDKVQIIIEKDIVKIPNGNIRRTMLHEIGHALGINHRENSIVSNAIHRPNYLTPLDRLSIKEFKKYIEEYK